MTLAQLAEQLTPHDPSTSSPQRYNDGVQRQAEIKGNNATAESEETLPPYPHAVLAGGFGGLTGDLLMHSLDTVKTRQQGDPHWPPKYHSLGNTYWTMFREEGVIRGLYGGVIPAVLGSFIGTSIFFGGYEWSKRLMIDHGMAPSLAYFNAGLVADLIASPIYVPTEVLKTRLQLQGRYNNPYFNSGYNYKSTWNAARTIVQKEGFATLFYGYRATLWRDLPFSALTFAVYEEERNFAKRYVGSSDIGISLEILTAMSAGAFAGSVTTPLDVVKTRIQTQVNPDTSKSKSKPSIPGATSGTSDLARKTASSSAAISAAASVQKRAISTSSPSTSIPKPGSFMLDPSSSIWTGLKVIYKVEGIGGLFRGVGPRTVWTCIQSGSMLVLYQTLLKYFDDRQLFGLQSEQR